MLPDSAGADPNTGSRGIRSGGGLARWPVKSWPCLYPGFPRSCPCRPDRDSVSSPRHFKRSMRSFPTTLTAKASSHRVHASFGLGADLREVEEPHPVVVIQTSPF